MSPIPTLRGYPIDSTARRIATRRRHNRRVRRAQRLLTARNRFVGRIWRSQCQIRPTERSLSPTGRACRQT
jgi:hypothetical protein